MPPSVYWKEQLRTPDQTEATPCALIPVQKARTFISTAGAAGSPDRRWRAAIHLGEDGVEATKAAEASACGNLGHRELGLVEEPLRALHARSLRNLNRARAEMPLKEPVQMTRSDTQSVCETRHSTVIKRAVLY